MEKEKLINVFDEMSANYDQQWSRLSSLNEGLHLLMAGLLVGLPEKANILCVGAGTGVELMYLANRFPHWTFTAVDPSSQMLEICRSKVAEYGFENRCEFHVGFIESLSEEAQFDGATSILVSHFIMDKVERTAYFQAISSRMKSGGLLVSSDLTADQGSLNYETLLAAWLEMMRANGVPEEGLANMRNAYKTDVALLPENEMEALIISGGFKDPVRFYQAGLIHAWRSVKGT